MEGHDNNSDEVDQLGPSHHIHAASEQPATSNQTSEQSTTTNKTSDPPSTSNQTSEQPPLSNHSKTSDDIRQPRRKKFRKTAAYRSEVFQRRVLRQRAESNKHLKEVSSNLKMLVEGTMELFTEILKNKQKN